MTLQQDVDVLRRIPLFAKIESARLKLLAFTSEHIEFAAGEPICRQGEQGDAAYIVLEGSADVVVQSDRATSNAVATRLGVRHETPQALLLRDGRVVWNASHYRLTADAIAKAVATHGNANPATR